MITRENTSYIRDGFELLLSKQQFIRSLKKAWNFNCKKPLYDDIVEIPPIYSACKSVLFPRTVINLPLGGYGILEICVQGGV